MARLLSDGVAVFEIGTPLCKAEGMRAVRALRESFPNKLILGDMKAPDVGGLEAKTAFPFSPKFGHEFGQGGAQLEIGKFGHATACPMRDRLQTERGIRLAKTGHRDAGSSVVSGNVRTIVRASELSIDLERISG